MCDFRIIADLTINQPGFEKSPMSRNRIAAGSLVLGLLLSIAVPPNCSTAKGSKVLLGGFIGEVGLHGAGAPGFHAEFLSLQCVSCSP